MCYAPALIPELHLSLVRAPNGWLHFVPNRVRNRVELNFIRKFTSIRSLVVRKQRKGQRLSVAVGFRKTLPSSRRFKLPASSVNTILYTASFIYTAV